METGSLPIAAQVRFIFLVNLPVGVIALFLVARARRSPGRNAPFDWAGQTTAVLAMGGITYGTIEAGAAGLGALLAAFDVGGLALAGFALAQARGRHPMVPRGLVRSRAVRVAAVAGFAFMVGYGLPFVLSLDPQGIRGLAPLATGSAFLPMMVIGAVVTPFSARLSGTASGVFNTSRQVGGALAVAVFGALLTDPHEFSRGVLVSLLIAAAVALGASAAFRLLPERTHP